MVKCFHYSTQNNFCTLTLTLFFWRPVSFPVAVSVGLQSLVVKGFPSPFIWSMIHNESSKNKKPQASSGKFPWYIAIYCTNLQRFSNSGHCYCHKGSVPILYRKTFNQHPLGTKHCVYIVILKKTSCIPNAYSNNTPNLSKKCVNRFRDSSLVVSNHSN